ADSLRQQLLAQRDSLQTSAQRLLLPLDSARQRLMHVKDSLATLQLPTGYMQRKIDSLNRLRSQTVSQLQTSAQAIHQKTLGQISALQLPPEVEQSLGIPGLRQAFELPLAEQPDLSGMASNPLRHVGAPGNTALPSLPGMDGLSKELPSYTADMNQLTQGNPDQFIENRASQLVDVKELNEGQQQIADLKGKTKMDSAALKDLVIEHIQQPALDHFAGKQELLQQAMDKMAKLKRQYSDVPSLKDLPKRVPNAMKGKPLIERLVPGLTFQFTNATRVLWDINPYVLYKVSGRIEAGAGWNHRLEFNRGLHNGASRIYGPRLQAGFVWKKGISFQVYPEWMNTLPTRNLNAPPESEVRQWVFSLPVGIKKTFRITRWLQGHSTVLYNLVDPRDMSPFSEPLMVRVGFEGAMRRTSKN
nr:hypothetical protein [Cyclobacteriaceae bacterium]